MCVRYDYIYNINTKTEIKIKTSVYAVLFFLYEFNIYELTNVLVCTLKRKNILKRQIDRQRRTDKKKKKLTSKLNPGQPYRDC